ncbi:MAG: aminomethyl-transferring glycine dehydrogenase [Denitrovibrio sp.]|nr:MAG: aminomethyl-transferring glycine dehydrogenase [Denitrovibrio sp.]
MKFTPHTAQEVAEMLGTIGVSEIDDLFAPIPAELKTEGLDLPKGISEPEAVRQLKKLSGKNKADMTCFLGGGVYDHFIPSAVDAISSRPEFYTAYTPYQPEASQGTLQALYEFQTMMCEMTGMEASNASMYDGGTALAEAALMALRISKKRNKIVIDSSVNPVHKKIVETYLSFLDAEVIDVVYGSGESVEKYIDGTVAGFLFQNPAFDGTVQDFTDIVAKVQADKSVAVASVYPISLGAVKSPGEMGFDVAVGDGQSLGNPLSFGGPYFGFMTTTKKHIRNLPGRITGKTVDTEGRDGYVLTLQAREQHIRRAKATSNICSNQSLCAMNGLFYMALMGSKGLEDVAALCKSKAEYAKEKLAELDGVSVVNDGITFNEFVIELPVNASEVCAKTAKNSILAGIPFGHYVEGAENKLLVAITEQRTKEEIDSLVSEIGGAI